MTPRPRLLTLIVAYNAEKTISEVFTRIPRDLADQLAVEILAMDDASQDRTFERCDALRRDNRSPFRLRVIANPVNQGYGGNQKLGYQAAIREGFDYVALLHGDGQYAPECLPRLLAPLLAGEADAVLGSRMLERGAALKGGMPIYKFVGNRILTFLQNRMLGPRLSEFHSGYRIYSVRSLKTIPFELNSNGFHFDTQIIIQLLFSGQTIREVPIPTYYGDEISHVNGIAYAWNVLAQTFIARLHQLRLVYDRKFDCAGAASAENAPSTGAEEKVAPDLVANH